MHILRQPRPQQLTPHNHRSMTLTKMFFSQYYVACAGALRQVVADDPFAQRIVTALAPTLGPIVQYAARTPFFSNIITALASSDDPVVCP